MRKEQANEEKSYYSYCIGIGIGKSGFDSYSDDYDPAGDEKANELITQVCSAINLELNSGSVKSDATSVPIDQLAAFDIEEMTINLKDSGDGKKHYATMSISLSMNKESDGYKDYGEKMPDWKSQIQSQITSGCLGLYIRRV